jgi:hypothetical protein
MSSRSTVNSTRAEIGDTLSALILKVHKIKFQIGTTAPGTCPFSCTPEKCNNYLVGKRLRIASR